MDWRATPPECTETATALRLPEKNTTPRMACNNQKESKDGDEGEPAVVMLD